MENTDIGTFFVEITLNDGHTDFFEFPITTTTNNDFVENKMRTTYSVTGGTLSSHRDRPALVNGFVAGGVYFFIKFTPLQVQVVDIAPVLETISRGIANLIASNDQLRGTQRKEVDASSILSDDRRKFCGVTLLPFSTVASTFKKFDSEEYRSALKAVVEQYAAYMSQMEKGTDEVAVVQPAIRDSFWPAVCEALQDYDKLQELFQRTDFVNERDYHFEETKMNEVLVVNGRVDHALLIQNSDVCCLTLEDKAVGLKMVPVRNTGVCSQAVAQAFTQVKAQVAVIRRSVPDYIPEEYVGVLQNGWHWILLSQKVDRGSTFDTYCVATTVPQIVQLLEHALCTAATIMNQILYPEQRPQRQGVPSLPSIGEGSEYSGGDRDDDDDLHDEDDRRPHPTVPSTSRGDSRQRLPPPPDVSSGKKGSKRADVSQCGYSNGGRQMYFNDYFVLPLTAANLAAHGTAVN